MALVLDQIAHRYGTDPLSVLEWEPERLSVALVCLGARDDRTAYLAERSSPMGVVVLNG